ncbi:MAG: hypothetical protein AAF456_23805, partial [Planctomycetota bacterium]
RNAVGQRGRSFLAATGDAEQLADKLLSFVNSKSLCHEQGQINKQRVIEEFSLEKMCNRTVELILSQLDRK